MKLFTWCADGRNYYDQPEEKEEREKKLAKITEEMAKLRAGDFEGCKVDDFVCTNWPTCAWKKSC